MLKIAITQLPFEIYYTEAETLSAATISKKALAAIWKIHLEIQDSGSSSGKKYFHAAK